MSARHQTSFVFLIGLVLAMQPLPEGQGAAPSSPLTLLTRDGRKPLASTVIDGVEMVALDDLATAFQVSVREDALASAVTVGYKGKTIVLTSEQALASVEGRLVSLPAPLARAGRRWLVPVEFVNRALALVYDARLDLRKDSRLLIVGDLRVPRVRVRYEPTSSRLRINIDIVPATPHAVQQESGRLLLALQADALDLSLPALAPQNLATGVHITESGNALAIELGPRFASFRSTTADIGRGATRLTLDLLGAEAETEPAPAPPASPPPETPLPFLAPATAVIRTIVIDPGHGGDEEGARGPSGALEKDITLSIGRRLKSAIESRLGIRVLLTRDDDRRVGLDERAAIANNNKADMFLSLHTNASLRRDARGAEIFYLSLDKHGDAARRSALEDSQLLPVFGGGSRAIEVILWEMAQARHIEQSAVLAGLIEEEFRGRIELGGRAIQQAPFRVLVGANMPAVLIEMGYISNADQEQQLASSGFQNQIAQAVFDGVLRFRDYLDSRRASTSSVAVRRPQAPPLDTPPPP